ncbi:MAG: SigE family RNA polymerase sigma factor [Actinomycetota bacterium]
MAAGELNVAALYTAHWRQMVRFAVLLVEDVATAEDVVQDAFVALYRHQHQLRSIDAAMGYVRAAVVNGSRSVIRKRQTGRRRLVLAGPEFGAGADYEVLLAAEHREAVQALRRLPRRQREVLVLRYWSGSSEAEIAATLGISTGSVKSAASRGIATLEKRLGGRR